MDETVMNLQDKLASLVGPPRVPALNQLAQVHARRYWQIGPGNPAGLDDLSAAISMWSEAYALLDRSDPLRGQVAGQLGWLLSGRYTLHGGGPEDQSIGINVLTEALTFTNLPPIQVTIGQLALGQLHLMRAMEALSPATLRTGFSGEGIPPTAGSDAGEAIRYFREVLDGPASSADIKAMARTMLDVATALQPLLAGSLANLDISKVMEAMTLMQGWMSNGIPGVPAGISMPEFPWSRNEDHDPIDNPVIPISEDTYLEPTLPPRQPKADTMVSTELGTARESARARLTALTGDRRKSPWEQALILLHTDPEQVVPEGLDSFVGAATNAAATAPDDNPLEAGVDRLLAAVGLCLRERRDGGGWGGGYEDAASGVSLSAAEELRVAAILISPNHPAAAVVVETVGALLDETRPLAGAIGKIAADIAEYAKDVTPSTITVRALRALCRTTAAILTDTTDDPDLFAAAVAAVPAGHPWQHALSTAVQQSRLATAVRAGDPDAVRAALGAGQGDLTELLDALLHDDIAVLRRTADRRDHLETADAPVRCDPRRHIP